MEHFFKLKLLISKELYYNLTLNVLLHYFFPFIRAECPFFSWVIFYTYRGVLFYILNLGFLFSIFKIWSMKDWRPWLVVDRLILELLGLLQKSKQTNELSKFVNQKIDVFPWKCNTNLQMDWKWLEWQREAKFRLLKNEQKM